MGSARRGSTGPWAVKDHQQLIRDTETGDEEGGLKRAVGALDLTALGIGAVIGTGIFVVIGEGIGKAGPAIIFSFLLAGLTCLFSALSYAELSSSIPVSGSAYTYAYATLGELLAWIIGWDLVLEYALSSATVATGWSGYFQSMLGAFGLHLPHAVAGPAIAYDPVLGRLVPTGALFNLPALFASALVTAVLVIGIHES